MCLKLEQDWGVILSLGEQQRVAFARCFIMRPVVAVLDESTSALDPENEELMWVHSRIYACVHVCACVCACVLLHVHVHVHVLWPVVALSQLSFSPVSLFP